MYASKLAPKGTKTIVAPRGRPMQDALAQLYCVTVPGLFRPKSAQAQPPVQQPPVQPPVQQPPAQQPPVQQPAIVPPPAAQPPSAQPVTQPAGQPPAPAPGSPGSPINQTLSAPASQAGATNPAQGVTPAVPGPQLPLDSAALRAGQIPPGTVPPGVPPAAVTIDTMSMYRGSMLAAQSQMLQERESLDSLAVEIHKKFALSFACLVFVLFGPPIALRFPRGGVGVTIGVSIVVFGLYYICLMGGEALADKGRLPAMVAMWIANVIFTIAGLLLLWRIESTTDGSRGGGLREWWSDRSARRVLAAERKARTRAKAAPQAPAATA